MGNYLNMHVCFSSLRTFLHVHTIYKTETQLPLTGTAVVSLDLHWHATVYTSPSECVPSAVCVISHSVCEEGLFLYVWVWPCHMCAGSRRIPRFRAGIVSVSPRWHADIYRNADVFVLLSSPWQRAHRSPRIPAQYQFAQADRSKWMQGAHTTAHTASGVEARHTHTSGVDTEGQKFQTPY